MNHRYTIDMSDYGRGARVYWWTTTVLGIIALSVGVSGAARLDGNGLLALAGLLALGFLTGLRPIRIPGTITSITPGDIFIFLTTLVWGPSVAVVVAATDAFAGSMRVSRRWTSRLGSPALMSLSVLISSEAFVLARNWLSDYGLLNTTTLFAALLMFAILHFLLNSLLTASLHALKQGKPLVALWWPNYCWISLTNLASASTAGLIFLSITRYGVGSILAALPLVAIVFATCHFYFKQADERARSSEQLSRVHLATVEALATAINAKDEITHDHVYRVRVYATGLARRFGLSEDEIEALKAGALLHDVGKIAVPDYILNKPGKLSAAEFEKMKVHTIVGAQIMERVNFPYPVVPIVRHHHERWDGRGYPDGLAGADIPITARILTVVDAFDAIREDRQYRKGMTRDEACAFLRQNAGTQFDPQIVKAFLDELPAYEQEILVHKANQSAIGATMQQGLSARAANAVPGAGLARDMDPTPDFIRQIHAVHVEVAALHELAQTVSASLDVSDVVTLTVSRIERMVPFTTCVFYLRQRDDSALAEYAFGRNAERIRGRNLAAGRGIAGWVIINARQMTNTDAMLDMTELLGPDPDQYRAAAVYPLLKGESAIGALALYSIELDTYSTEHLYLLESVSRLASTALQHAMLHEETRSNIQADVLTGLLTGPALYEALDAEIRAATDRTQSLIVLSLRLFGLRSVNDTHGYSAGDRVLTEAAIVLRHLIGQTGLLGRVAGDEFIAILRDCARREALLLSEVVRNEIDAMMIEVRPGQTAKVCLSYAMEEYVHGQTANDLLNCLTTAARIGASAHNPPHNEPGSADSRMVS
jgi:diguanylate cyclase (GGDEF)-like protein/putative nucleotidyltransferase with HDIG domain